MAGIGMGFYLIKIPQKNNFINLGFLLLLFSLLVQLLYYSMNYFIIVSMPYDQAPSDFLNLIREIKLFASSLSLMLLVSGVGLAVLVDNYIIYNFFNRIIYYSDFSNTHIKRLNFFANPFSYILNCRLRSILKINNECNISDSDFKKFSKLALMAFKEKKKASIYINEAESLLNSIK